MSARRYAVYFVPAPDTALHRFGAGVIGYDCTAGAEVPFWPGLDAAEADWRALTREPRTYGFHATLKAPFRLRPGLAERDLVDEFERFAAGCAHAGAFDPAVRIIAGFAAVIPHATAAQLGELADACVIALEPFRAPMAAKERERRLAAALTPRQVAHLDRWGYPYVFEDFRFHMTLTGPLPPGRSDGIVRRLAALFAQSVGKDRIVVDRIALLRQDSASERFIVIRAAPIGGGAPAG